MVEWKVFTTVSVKKSATLSANLSLLVAQMITAPFTTHFFVALSDKLKVLVITLDLSIFLKSVDIIPSQKLAIVPRLNGYHLLKSAEEVADSILNNNTYDKAFRVYFLIDAAIGQHIPSKNQFFSTAR